MSQNDLIHKICDLVKDPRALKDAEISEATAAFEDTLAVAYAGWHEPVTQALLSVYRGGEVPLIDGTTTALPETAAMIHATAGHALDYDDVQLESVTHPSVVIVPALLALCDSGHGIPSRLASAYAVGLAVNVAVGSTVDFSHYRSGWHATSTIGGIAGTAAAAHLLSLSETETRRALAIAASQAGGMQIQFGTDVKPLHAGLAAAVSVRSVLMANAGMTAAMDLFAPRGFLDLYAPDRNRTAAPIAPEINLITISRKLYPCCYASHRMIAAAVKVHGQTGGVPNGARIRMQVPDGLMTPLNVDIPETGLQGKFSARYLVATALLHGQVKLGDFYDTAVTRPDVRAVMENIDIEVDDPDPAAPVGIGHGVVRLDLLQGNDVLAHAEARHYPGAPDSPATVEEMDAKITDCLQVYSLESKDGPDLAEFRQGLSERFKPTRAAIAVQ
ncbi:MmgE/PrpD family protein [Pseudooceanicola sp.]|uniref:MmgE/PrpD family protein n=1 Tax=Pseudooceanicola sp. TaxID=1914328 RepID=UPI0026392B5D|nr:MmgE/PrpD family protein [Pseudooceanicola sp.]MDF1857182.1 MmgE/PrpD family protein [Pseudooceanicola sp.]